MENFLKSLFDFTKLPTKIFFLISVVSGFLLFANENLVAALKLEKFNLEYGSYFGIAFLLTTGIFLVNSFIWIINKISRTVRTRQIRKNFRKDLKRLDPREQAVIREFSINGQSSIRMPIDDPVVSGLLNKQILKINSQISGNTFVTGMLFPISLNKYADEILTLQDIGMPLNPTDEEKRLILNSRPVWTQRIRF